MKESTHFNHSSIRQAELHRQICEAKHCKQHRRLFSLEAQWVHRFGLQPLPQAIESLDSSISLDPLQDQFELNELNIDEIKQLELSSESICKEGEFGDEGAYCDIDLDPEKEKIINQFNRESFEGDQIQLGDTCELNLNYHKDQFTTKKVPVASPPSPSLNRFRRWLSNDSIEFPKAS